MSKGSNKSNTYLIKFQREAELRTLFNQLDSNGDGRLCEADIVSALRRLHAGSCEADRSERAHNFLAHCGLPKNGSLTFEEFSAYVLRHDQLLATAFEYMDKDERGIISLQDVQLAFKLLGEPPLSRQEAESLLHRVDQSGSMVFDFGQWRQYLLFHLPLFKNKEAIFQRWRNNTFLDVGCCDTTLTDLPVEADVDSSQLNGSSESKPARQLRQLLAGACAGAVSRTSTAPIDRLKLMRQVHGFRHKNSGFIEAYKYMLKEGGLQSLWRGNGINVLKFAPETAIKYGSYEHYKRWLTQNSCDSYLEDRPLLAKFLAGSLAGSTAQTIIYPMEVLKTRMCLRKTGQYRSLGHCAKSVYMEGGRQLTAFYRGYLVNLLGIIPYAGIELAMYEVTTNCRYIFGGRQLTVFYRGYLVNLLGIIPYADIELAMYEFCKSTYIDHYMMTGAAEMDPRLQTSYSPSAESESAASSPTYHQSPPLYAIPLLASLSASCAIALTYPANLLRAKLQAAYWSRSTHSKITALTLMGTIWSEDGPKGFYRGLATNLAKVVPAVGINLATYEWLRRRLELGPLGSG